MHLFALKNEEHHVFDHHEILRWKIHLIIKKAQLNK